MEHLEEERRRYGEVLELIGAEERGGVVGEAMSKSSAGAATVDGTRSGQGEESTKERPSLFDEPGIDRASLDLVLNAFADEVQAIRREEAFSGSREDVELLATSLAAGQGGVVVVVEGEGKGEGAKAKESS